MLHVRVVSPASITGRLLERLAMVQGVQNLIVLNGAAHCPDGDAVLFDVHESAANLGVFISVTTIPAAADVGVSIAFGSWRRARGSALQLVLNVVLLIAVSAVGLAAQRAIWRRIGTRQIS